MVTDPVCGTELNPKTAEWLVSFEGRAFFFCSANCECLFEANPFHYCGTELIEREVEADQIPIAVPEAIYQGDPTSVAISR